MGGAAKSAGRTVTRATGGSGGLKTPSNILVEKWGGKDLADQYRSIQDPADLFGFRQKEEKKKAEEQAKKAEDNRKKEVDELFKKYSPGNIKQTSAIKATTIANKLKKGLKVADGDVQFLRTFAQSQGPSNQAQSLLQAQELEQKGLMENLYADQSRAQAEQFSNLAQQGGLGAGSRERLSAAGRSAGLREQQDARRGGALARLGILSEDESRKLNVAGALPGQQVGVSAERRAGLSADQDALLRAQESTQSNRLKENAANLATKNNLFNQRAGILGGSQMSEAQKRAAANSQGGPLGKGTGVLGLNFGNMFGG